MYRRVLFCDRQLSWDTGLEEENLSILSISSRSVQGQGGTTYDGRLLRVGKRFNQGMQNSRWYRVHQGRGVFTAAAKTVSPTTDHTENNYHEIWPHDCDAKVLLLWSQIYILPHCRDLAALADSLPASCWKSTSSNRNSSLDSRSSNLAQCQDRQNQTILSHSWTNLTSWSTLKSLRLTKPTLSHTSCSAPCHPPHTPNSQIHPFL